MKKYLTIPFYTGCMSGSLDEKKLTGTLNEYASQGWRLAKTINETKKVYFFFHRETHFMIFEKDE